MFCALCRRLFWRDPKPGGRLTSRSKHAQSAGRRTGPEAVSGRMKSNGIRDQDWQSLKCSMNIFQELIAGRIKDAEITRENHSSAWLR